MAGLNRRAVLGLAGAAVTGGFASTRATRAAATPTPLSPDLRLRYYEILDDRNGGALHVLGEYTNLSTRVIVAPVLGLALSNEAGTLLETDNLFPASAQLMPGDTGGFSGGIHLARGAWTHARLSVCQTDQLGAADETFTLELRDLVEITKTAAQLHVTGWIANTGNAAIRDLGVRAILTRTRDGRFAGVGATTLAAPLPAHAAAAFSLMVASAEMPGIQPGEDYAYRLEPHLTRALGIQCDTAV